MFIIIVCKVSIQKTLQSHLRLLNDHNADVHFKQTWTFHFYAIFHVETTFSENYVCLTVEFVTLCEGQLLSGGYNSCFLRLRSWFQISV